MNNYSGRIDVPWLLVGDGGDLIVSGEPIARGVFPNTLSGMILRGTGPYQNTCHSCGAKWYGESSVVVTGISGFYSQFCHHCVDWEWRTGFPSRKDWILEGVPFSSGAPLEVVSDYLEENGRAKDAEYLRGWGQGKPR